MTVTYHPESPGKYRIACHPAHRGKSGLALAWQGGETENMQMEAGRGPGAARTEGFGQGSREETPEGDMAGLTEGRQRGMGSVLRVCVREEGRKRGKGRRCHITEGPGGVRLQSWDF